jgi:hypothetical protein
MGLIFTPKYMLCLGPVASRLTGLAFDSVKLGSCNYPPTVCRSHEIHEFQSLLYIYVCVYVYEIGLFNALYIVYNRPY